MPVLMVVITVVIVAGAGFLAWNQARTLQLRRRFGPEYDRAVDRLGGRREAERELHARTQHHQELGIRPLDERVRARYLEEWARIQALFVDDPGPAVDQAGQLVITVMGERGYPAGDFEVRLAVLSVEHARALDHYRNGHEISVRDEASTEDLRQAMVHYRAVVGDLLSAEVPALSGRPRGDE